MDLRQAAQTIFDTAARNLALALALCGANLQLSDAVEELWYEHLKGPESAVLQSETDEDPSGQVPPLPAVSVSFGASGTEARRRGAPCRKRSRPVALKVAYPGAEAAAGTCPLRAEYASASAVQHPNVRRVDELLTVEPRNERVMQMLVME